MARTVGTGRPVAIDAQRQLKLIKAAELIVQDVEFFNPAKGLDTSTRISHMDRSHCSVLKNYTLMRGRLEQRNCVAILGNPATSEVMYAAEFVSVYGDRLPFRFTRTGMDVYDKTTQLWTNVPAAVFTGGPQDFFTVTVFGAKLLFSNGVDGLWEFDPVAGAVTKISTSSSVPSARHLATFNNRVIAANVLDATGRRPNRLRWCVKNSEMLWDETDQVNIGAGFEEPQPSPGLEVEACRGVFPVTESVALLVMSNSLRLMTETDFVDAPFRFSYLLPGLGTDSPYSLVQIPAGGVIGFFKDNFYVVSLQAPVPIGDKIVDALIPQIKDPLEMVGAYDPIRQEYRVIIKETDAVWRYSLREKGWTNDVYPWIPKFIGTTRYDKTNLTIDQLPGTIDSLVGTIDDLGLQQRVTGVYITHGNRVTREDPDFAIDDQEQGIGSAEIRTGLILPETPLKKIEMVEIQLEYETEVGANIVFDWSSDAGTTWHTLGTFSIDPTDGPDVLSVRRAISAKQLQVRMTTITLFVPTVIALHVFVLPGAMRKP